MKVGEQKRNNNVFRFSEERTPEGGTVPGALTQREEGQKWWGGATLAKGNAHGEQQSRSTDVSEPGSAGRT